MPVTKDGKTQPGITLPTDRLLNSEEVRAILNIRRLLLYELIKRGELRSVRVGRHHRFLPSEVIAYIARGGGKVKGQ